MGFERTGRKGVAPLLLHKYEELRDLQKIGEELPAVDSKKSFRKVDATLDSQIKAADRAGVSPDVAALASQLHLDRLSASDPIQAAHFQHVVQKYREDFARVAAGQAPTRTLETTELRAFLALAGEKLSREEAFMLRMLEPLMTLEQREVYRDARKIDFDLEGTRLGPAELARLALQMYAPYTPVMGAAVLGGYGVITGEALSVTLIGAMSGGLTVGEYLQKKAIQEKKGSYGVNFLEDQKVGNELHRLHDQVSKPIPELEKIGDRLETDVGLFQAIIELRGTDVPPAFAGYLEAAKAAKQNLDTIVEQARGQPIDPAVLEQYVRAPLAEARKQFLAQVKPEDLEQLAAGIRPHRVLNDEQVRLAVNRLVALNVSETLSLVNAPLAHQIARLEKEVDVDKHVETRDAKKLDEASIAALRLAVGKEPSLPEIMGLSKLVYSGAVELKDLWPNVDHVLLNGKTKLDARELIADVAKLGFQDEAKWKETFGRLLKGPLSQGIGVGSLSALILFTELAFWPWGFLVGFGTRFLGLYLGQHIEKKALEQRATKGLDYVGGRPNATEYELLLDDLKDPKRFLTAEPAQLKEMCARQASVIRKTIEGLESIVPLLGEKDKADLQTHQRPIYDALQNFASQLDAIARGDPQAPKFQAAWSQLFSPELERLVQRDILRQASTDDFVADPRSRLVNAKLELVAGLAKLLESGGNMTFQQFVSAWKNNRLRNDAFVKLAQTVKEAGDEFDRASLSFWQKIASGIPFIGKQFAKGHELDDVERFANQVLSARWDPAALSDLVKIYENTTEIRERLDTELREHWPVDEKRSTGIAQEMLDVMWERVHGLLGSDAGEAPRFKGTAELRNDEKGAFYWVTGEIDGGKGANGRLEIRVDPYGIVDLDSIKTLDLGEAVLKRFAAAAVEKTIPGAEAKRVELIGREQEQDYRFDVRTKAGDHYSVTVSPDGFARKDSIERGEPKS